MQQPIQDPGTSQWVINALLGTVSALTTILMGVGAYVLNLYRNKVDALEAKQSQNVADFASQVKLAALETFVASLASRQELVACMNQLREDAARMHAENQESIRDMREDFRNVHGRIDDILNRKQ